MASNSIQFRGLDGVIGAYENRNVPAWSLWQGKQFMFKYEGSDIAEGAEQLKETLDLLSQASNAVYTLKIYEDLPGGKIKSNTPDDGSFNFKLNGEEQAITQNQYASYKHSVNVNERLDKIEALLLAKEEEEEEEEPSKLGLIGDIISHPTLQPIVQNIFTSLLSGISKTFASAAVAMPQRAAINGVTDEAQLSQAINDLKQADPKLIEHLTKLATLAKQSPDTFNLLLSTLDSM